MGVPVLWLVGILIDGYIDVAYGSFSTEGLYNLAKALLVILAKLITLESLWSSLCGEWSFPQDMVFPVLG